jgi:chromosome segregation ATPase
MVSTATQTPAGESALESQVERLKQQLVKCTTANERLIAEKGQGQVAVRQLRQTVEVLRSTVDKKDQALQLRQRDLEELSKEGQQLRAQKLAQHRELKKRNLGMQQKLQQQGEQLEQLEKERKELGQVVQQQGQQLTQLEGDNSSLRLQVQQQGVAYEQGQRVKEHLQQQLQQQAQGHQQQVAQLTEQNAQLQQQAQQQGDIVAGLQEDNQLLLRRAQAAEELARRLRQAAAVNNWRRLVQGEWGAAVGLPVLLWGVSWRVCGPDSFKSRFWGVSATRTGPCKPQHASMCMHSSHDAVQGSLCLHASWHK